mgnify:CR=1 FL=1
MATSNTLLGMLACLAGPHCAAAQVTPQTSPAMARRPLVQLRTTPTAARHRGDAPVPLAGSRGWLVAAEFGRRVGGGRPVGGEQCAWPASVRVIANSSS